MGGQERCEVSADDLAGTGWNGSGSISAPTDGQHAGDDRRLKSRHGDDAVGGDRVASVASAASVTVTTLVPTCAFYRRRARRRRGVAP